MKPARKAGSPVAAATRLVWAWRVRVYAYAPDTQGSLAAFTDSAARAGELLFADRILPPGPKKF